MVKTLTIQAARINSTWEVYPNHTTLGARREYDVVGKPGTTVSLVTNRLTLDENSQLLTYSGDSVIGDRI